MSNLADITDYLIRFRDERHWAQFHNSKDLAIALSIEAAELNEIFLWKKDTEIEDIERVEQKTIADELADVLVYALMFAHRNGFDVEKIIMDKMKKKRREISGRKSKG